MKKQHGFTLVEVTVVLFGLLCVGGYIANIVKLIGVISDPITLLTVLRIIGAFPAIPLGVILGFV